MSVQEHHNQHQQKRIRVLVSKLGLDGHDRGALVICRALRDAGMEVIYSGLFCTPEQVENKANDILLVGGGIIPESDKKILEKEGITGNFGPGTPLSTIINHISEHVKKLK